MLSYFRFIIFLLCIGQVFSKKKVIYDTDLSVDVDDTLALLLALASHSDIEVIGIHVVGSLAKTTGAIMTKKFATYMGWGNIPVFIGADETISKKNRFNLFGHEGISILSESEYDYWKQFLINDNDEYLSKLYKEADAIIAVGPLTNVAYMLDRGNKIKDLYIMGGSLVNEIYPTTLDIALTRDYNLRIDADAAVQVFTSSHVENIIMVTGNITLSCWMNYKDLRKMEAAMDRFPWLDIGVKQIKIWSDIQAELFAAAGFPPSDDNVAYLHDPLTVGAALNEANSFLTFEDMSIAWAFNEAGVLHTVNYNGNKENLKEQGLGFRNMKVSVDVNCPKFRKLLLDRLLNYHYPGFVPRSPHNIYQHCNNTDSSVCEEKRH